MPLISCPVIFLLLSPYVLILLKRPVPIRASCLGLCTGITCSSVSCCLCKNGHFTDGTISTSFESSTNSSFHVVQNHQLQSVVQVKSDCKYCLYLILLEYTLIWPNMGKTITTLLLLIFVGTNFRE